MHIHEMRSIHILRSVPLISFLYLHIFFELGTRHANSFQVFRFQYPHRQISFQTHGRLKLALVSRVKRSKLHIADGKSTSGAELINDVSTDMDVPPLTNMDAKFLEELMKNSDFLTTSSWTEVQMHYLANIERNLNSTTEKSYDESRKYSSRTFQTIEDYTLRWGELIAKIVSVLSSATITVRNKAELDIKTVTGITAALTSQANAVRRILSSVQEPNLLLTPSSFTNNTENILSKLNTQIELALIEIGSNPFKRGFGSPELLNSLKGKQNEAGSNRMIRDRWMRKKISSAFPQQLINAAGKADDLAYVIEQEIKYEKPGRRTVSVLNRVGIPLALSNAQSNILSGAYLSKDSNIFLPANVKMLEPVVVSEIEWIYEQLQLRPPMLLTELRYCLSRSSIVEAFWNDIDKLAYLAEHAKEETNIVIEKFEMQNSNDFYVELLNYLKCTDEAIRMFTNSVGDALPSIQKYTADLKSWEQIICNVEFSMNLSTKFEFTSDLLEIMRNLNACVAEPLFYLSRAVAMAQNGITFFRSEAKFEDVDGVKTLLPAVQSFFSEINIFISDKKNIFDLMEASVIPPLREQYLKLLPKIEKFEPVSVLNGYEPYVEAQHGNLVVISDSEASENVLWDINSNSDGECMNNGIFDISPDDVVEVEDSSAKAKTAVLKSLDVFALILEKAIFVVLPSLVSKCWYAGEQMKQLATPQGTNGWKLHSLLKEKK